MACDHNRDIKDGMAVFSARRSVPNEHRARLPGDVEHRGQGSDPDPVAQSGSLIDQLRQLALEIGPQHHARKEFAFGQHRSFNPELGALHRR